MAGKDLIRNSTSEKHMHSPVVPPPVTVVSCLLHVFIPHAELPDCLTFGYQVQISLIRYAGRECEKVGFPLHSRFGDALLIIEKGRPERYG